MNPEVSAMVEYAEDDFVTALTMFRSRKRAVDWVVCFHAQQCVEKYLKAWLLERGEVFPKSHDLVLLIEIIDPIEPLWIGLRPLLGILSDHAVTSRYPGDLVDRDDAKESLKIMREVRSLIRERLGLD